LQFGTTIFNRQKAQREVVEAYNIRNEISAKAKIANAEAGVSVSLLGGGDIEGLALLGGKGRALEAKKR
jgi:hypothetical protein